MGVSVKPSPAGTHANDRHAGLQAITGDLHVARISANPLSRAAVRHAMAQTGTSQKAFAITAGAAESAVADALNGRGRHLETDWILAQDDAFVLAFWRYIETERRLTVETARAVKAERIAELVRLIVESA